MINLQENEHIYKKSLIHAEKCSIIKMYVKTYNATP